jgi:hypothetical protein
VVTYLAVSFALLEAVWLLAPRLGLVEAATRLVTGIVVLGFPFAVVLAWTYDLTPQGIVRTPDDPPPDLSDPPKPLLRRTGWVLLCAVLVAVGFVLRTLRG